MGPRYGGGHLRAAGDSDDPTGIVASLAGVVPAEIVVSCPPASYPVITHRASDIRAGQVSTATYRITPLTAEPATLHNG